MALFLMVSTLTPSDAFPLLPANVQHPPIQCSLQPSSRTSKKLVDRPVCVKNPEARAREPSTQISFPKFDHRKKKLCRGQVLESTGLQDIYISKSQSAIWTSYHPHAYASLFHSSANVESVSPAILRFALGSHCARKGLRRATFLCPKRVPKTKKKVASKNPKPKGKLLSHCVTRT